MLLQTKFSDTDLILKSVTSLKAPAGNAGTAAACRAARMIVPYWKKYR